MNGIYRWVQNIVYYLIFITVLLNLLPSGKYEKYLRLFAGAVLILLVLQPVTGGLRLEDKITAIFEKISFYNDAGELQQEIQDMENQRLEELVRRYEEETARDITRMAALNGMEGQEVSVAIDKDPESPSFGAVTQVSILLKKNSAYSSDTRENREMDPAAPDGIQAGSGKAVAVTGPDPGSAGTQEENPNRVAAPIERVEIRIEGADFPDEGNKDLGERRGSGGEAQEAAVYPEEWKKLRRQIAGYYEVEEQYVEIRVENE